MVPSRVPPTHLHSPHFHPRLLRPLPRAGVSSHPSQPLPALPLTEGDTETLPEMRGPGRGLVAEQCWHWTPGLPMPSCPHHPEFTSRHTTSCSHSSPTRTWRGQDFSSLPWCLAVSSNQCLQRHSHGSREAKVIRIQREKQNLTLEGPWPYLPPEVTLSKKKDKQWPRFSSTQMGCQVLSGGLIDHRGISQRFSSIIAY